LKLLDYYFGGFIDEKVEYEPCDDIKREIEQIKSLMVTVGKTKGDNDKMVDRIYDNKKKTEPAKKKLYQEVVSKNTRKIYQVLRQIELKIKRYNIDLEVMGNLRKERLFKAIKYDAEEIKVIYSKIGISGQRETESKRGQGTTKHRHSRS
jgi:hypothetical protein